MWLARANNFLTKRQNQNPTTRGDLVAFALYTVTPSHTHSHTNRERERGRSAARLANRKAEKFPVYRTMGAKWLFLFIVSCRSN